MKFHYIIPAYNEESQLRQTFQEISAVRNAGTDIEILFVDNGSIDGTWNLVQTLASQNSQWVKAYREDQKGLGRAFSRGLKELETKDLGKSDWAVYCAADLPFGFTDLEALKAQDPSSLNKTVLYVGSKRHPHSQISRHWKRVLGSTVFEFLRWMLLPVKTKDTQGSLFLRGDHVNLVKHLKSVDYFFSVELVFFAERVGDVVEIPVTYHSERRPSRISLFRDGFKTIWQLWNFRRDLKSRS